jgi:hypothetical protein
VAIQPASLGRAPTSAPELAFAVRGAAPERFAAAPALSFELAVERRGGGPIQSIVLAIQLRIAATRRGYSVDEQTRLGDLFGRPEDWGRNLHSLLWTNVSVVVPPFVDATTVAVPVPCTYDLEVKGSAYLQALEGGEVPLEFLFSGALFYSGADGRLQTARISWEAEAEYRLPVAVWKETMERHFPGSAWLRVDKATFDRLCTYKSTRALPTWAEVFDELLPPVPEAES